METGALEGQRDYCLPDTALQTGRRLAELSGLRWGDVEITGSR